MIWNEIRNRLRERLPAIIDFVLYIAAMTIIAAVLLGLTWLLPSAQEISGTVAMIHYDRDVL